MLTGMSKRSPWTRTGSVMPNCSVIDLPGRCELWAGDINKIGDQYVLYYSVSAIGSQNSAIGVATSPTMEEGTWTDLGEVIRTDGSQPYNASA